MTQADTPNDHNAKAEENPPSVNDVLSQQMGTKYTEVENLDKAELQKDLQSQAGHAQEDQFDRPAPSGDETDDRNTSDGQLIGS